MISNIEHIIHVSVFGRRKLISMNSYIISIKNFISHKWIIYYNNCSVVDESFSKTIFLWEKRLVIKKNGKSIFSNLTLNKKKIYLNVKYNREFKIDIGRMADVDRKEIDVAAAGISKDDSKKKNYNWTRNAMVRGKIYGVGSVSYGEKRPNEWKKEVILLEPVVYHWYLSKCKSSGYFVSI